MAAKIMYRREFNSSLIAATFGAVIIPLQSAPPSYRVNGPRLSKHIAGLAEFGRNPQGGVSRIAYSQADRDGREYVIGLMRGAGLEIQIDAAGNIVGKRPGTAPGLPPIVMGSHIDSVPEGGNYDGPVGSLSGIEVAQVLMERKIQTRHPVEVLIFQNEEGGQYGSRILIGAVSSGDLDEVSLSGKTIREGIRFIGGTPDRIESAVRRPGDVRAYMEIHIEQGAVLESEKLQVGIVEGIVGLNRHEVTIEGMANHAGTTPMNLRHDALLAGARLIDAVNRVVTSVPGRQVGTVGKIEALPGAPNVIPGSVTLTIELRDIDWDKIRMLYEKIVRESHSIAQGSDTKINFREFYVNHPSPSDETIRRFMVASAKELGLTYKLMPSGAGHDAQGMARITDMGMIFIPSVGGISHSPKEYSRPEDIENGANLMLHTLLRLDAS